jgi:cell filamentation protein
VNGIDPYCFPGSTVLRNKLGIMDAQELDYVERELVTQRAREGAPTGRFDLAHLRAIHKHLFQDVYDWAGQLRTVEISKGGHQFQFRRFIETGMADIHNRLKKARFLRNLCPAEFAIAAGGIIGDVNYVYHFREGNGRTQLFYLEQLAEKAGHPIDLGLIDPGLWIAASEAAHRGDYARMGEAIGRSLEFHTNGKTLT